MDVIAIDKNGGDKFITTMDEVKIVGLKHFDNKRNEGLVLKSGRKIQDFYKKRL